MNFLKKLFGFSIGPVIGAFLSFITIPMTTYFISPEEYGKSSMFLTIQVLLVSLVYLGFDQSYSREYHSYKNKKKLFQNAILFPLLFSILVIFIFSIFRYDLSVYLFGTADYWLVAINLGVLMFFTVIERFILMDVRMQEEAYKYSLYSIFIKLSLLVITMVYILFGYRNFLVVVNSTIYGQIIFDVYLLFRHIYLFDFRKFKFDRQLFTRMCRFGLPLMISVFLTSFLSSSGRFFLGSLGTFYDLGIFTAAAKVAGLLTIIQSSFTSFWLPTAYRWNKEGQTIKKFRLVSDGLAFALSMILMFIIIFKSTVVFFISSRYHEAQYVLPLMCLSPLLYTLSETVTLGIAFSRKSYLNILIGILSVIPCVILNITLISKYGIKGAAVSQAFGFLLFYYLRKYYSCKSGFKMKNFKQSLIVFILFVISFLNMFSIDSIQVINIITFIVLIWIQYPIFLEIKKINKG